MSRIFDEIDNDVPIGALPFSSATTDPPQRLVLLRGMKFNSREEDWMSKCWADGPHTPGHSFTYQSPWLCERHLVIFRPRAA